MIDQLAREGVIYDRAYSVANWTMPSAASILTGRYPATHGFLNFVSSLPAGMVTLPEALASWGYRSVSVLTPPMIAEPLGFDKRFHVHFDLEDVAGLAQQEDRRRPDLLRVGWRVAPLLRDMEAVWRSGRTFLMMWNVITHTRSYAFGTGGPYCRSHRPGNLSDLSRWFRSGRKDRIVDRYDDGVVAGDGQLADVIEMMKRNSVYDDALIAVTADHGEALGDRGRLGHGLNPYEEQIRIPLILKLPGGAGAGTRVSTPVSLVDLFPTFLAAAGGRGLPGNYDGESLLEGDKPRELSPERGLLVEGFPLRSRPRYFRAVVTERWKLMRSAPISMRRPVASHWFWEEILKFPCDPWSMAWRVYDRARKRRMNSGLVHYESAPEAGATRLYDLQADPQELCDRARERASVVAELEQVLLPPIAPARGGGALRASLQNRLRELGYPV